MTIDSQGFRNYQDFTIRSRTKARIICSGDSFTFGYGVDNVHTWCERLTALDDRLETINMGCPGYGVDQAFLQYFRDGAKLEHRAQIFAFITEDFDRMLADRFITLPKPVLRLRDGRLVTENVPVPEMKSSLWSQRISPSLLKLPSQVLLSRVLRKLNWSILPHNYQYPKNDELFRIVSKNFRTVGTL